MEVPSEYRHQHLNDAPAPAATVAPTPAVVIKGRFFIWFLFFGFEFVEREQEDLMRRRITNCNLFYP